MSVQEIDQLLKAAVDSGGVPCVVAMAADDDGLVYEGAAGTRTPNSGDALTPDTMLRIASMTKMVTTVAALQQVERGNLDLDAPVEEYRPEFADVAVLDSFDGDTPRLRPPATRATVHQLVTHTTGLGYWFINADIARSTSAPPSKTRTASHPSSAASSATSSTRRSNVPSASASRSTPPFSSFSTRPPTRRSASCPNGRRRWPALGSNS